MPKVSVIIPVYRVEEQLPACLDRIVNQTLKDIEIICVNDCSPDNCSEILQNYAQKDCRIKIINFKENKGAGAARNAGIDAACGEYTGFVDGDDFIDLDFYEKLYNKAAATGVDAVKGELWEINDSTSVPYMPANYDLNSLIKKDKAYFYYTFTTAIYSKKFLDKYKIRFPEGLCHLEDPYFTIKAAFYYDKLEIADNAKYYYVTTGATRNKKPDIVKTVKSLYKGVMLISDMINNADISEKHYKIVSAFVLGQILHYCNDVNIPDTACNILMQTLSGFYLKNKYKNEILPMYYKNKRLLFFENYKNNTFRNLRAKRNDR